MDIETGFSRDADFAAVIDSENNARDKRRLVIIVAAVILAVILLMATLIAFNKPKTVTATTPDPAVTVIIPGRQSVTISITATGDIAARREMPVGVAGDGGMVARVLVEPGDWVAMGQTLAVIDQSVQTQEARSLEASVRVARADAALAQAELDRAQALVARGFISKADIERKTATRDSANAGVAVTIAQLGQARAKQSRLNIRAPAAGLVLTRAVEPGQVVSSGSGALFRVARDGEMEVLGKVSEADLAKLTVGAQAEVTPVGSNRSFAGTVWQLSPIIDPATRQGTARVRMAYDPNIRPGGFAALKLMAGKVDAPLLPESAVLSDGKGNYVFVVKQNNVAERRQVIIGDTSDSGITILSGLNGKERVVLSAGAFLNPGDKVIPTLLKNR